jgi:hypothetical protein
MRLRPREVMTQSLATRLAEAAIRVLLDFVQ